MRFFFVFVCHFRPLNIFRLWGQRAKETGRQHFDQFYLVEYTSTIYQINIYMISSPYSFYTLVESRCTVHIESTRHTHPSDIVRKICGRLCCLWMKNLCGERDTISRLDLLVSLWYSFSLLFFFFIFCFTGKQSGCLEMFRFYFCCFYSFSRVFCWGNTFTLF